MPPPRSFLFRLLAEGISPSDVSSKSNGDIACGTYTTYGTERLPVFVKLALGLSPSESSWFTLNQGGADKSEDETSWCIIKDGCEGQDPKSAEGASVAGVCAHQV
jgi:hypothetical protein